MKFDKLIYPATILIASIIIGGSLYAVQVNKQNSIEKQQRLELEQNKFEMNYNKEKDKLEYILKRKKDCNDFESKIAIEYSNTIIGEAYYDEENDSCYLIYEMNASDILKKDCNSWCEMSKSHWTYFVGRNCQLCKENKFMESYDTF